MRIVRFAAVACAAALALAGCGGSTSGTVTASSPSASANPSAEVKDALARSLAARSAATVFDTTMTTADGRTVTYTMKGRMRLDGLEAEASGVLPAGAIPGIDAEVPIRMIGYHGTVYYHYDFPNGRSIWIKVDAGAEQAAAGAALPSDSQLKALDSLTDIQKVATEKVDGVDATHYRGVMDSKSTADLFRNMGASAPPSVTTPLDVWVDGQGHVVREDMALDLDGSHMTVSMHFSDWGVAVKVTPPTGAIDIKDLQKQQKQTQG